MWKMAKMSKTIATNLEFDVLSQPKVLSIEIQIFFEMCSMHKVRELFRYREVTVTRHLFARVDTARAVQTGITVRGRVAVVP